MKLLRKLTAFILVFGLLAGTVAAMSAAVFTDNALVMTEEPTLTPDEELADEPMTEADAKTEIADTGATAYTPRLTAPAKTNKYYYSDQNIFYKYSYGMPNCTCYAWGRAYEITKKTPSLCVYSAYLWYDYNKENKIYTYGNKPKLGAIACWVYSSGNAGHVAVVEKIEKNTITFSNSAYGGEEFYLSTAPVDDPSDGNATWIFQGYIYLGDYESADTSTDKTAANSASTGDVYRITSDDGVNLRSGAGTSHQALGCIPYGVDVTVTKTKKAEGYLWGYTNYNGKNGWFVTDFAKLMYHNTGDTAAKTPAQNSQPATQAPTQAPTQPPTAAPTKAAVKETTASEAPAPPPTEPPTEPVTEAQSMPFEYAPLPSRDVMMGDVDGDGIITILDATRIQLVVAELYVPTKYMLIVGDYDGDSVFSVMDASHLRYDLAFELIAQ